MIYLGHINANPIKYNCTYHNILSCTNNTSIMNCSINYYTIDSFNGTCILQNDTNLYSQARPTRNKNSSNFYYDLHKSTNYYIHCDCQVPSFSSITLCDCNLYCQNITQYYLELIINNNSYNKFNIVAIMCIYLGCIIICACIIPYCISKRKLCDEI